MNVYLASPANQLQASHAEGMPVLFSFSEYSPFLDRYQQTFSRILIDSGAYSALTTGVKIDVMKYKDWAARWGGHADAIAGLDDIEGDWRLSLKNYEHIGFPTIHDTDPHELLPELIEIAKDRGNWLGIGLKPPRHGKETWIRKTLDRVPEDIHVHGWALRAYTHIRRIDSVDSTNWFRRAWQLRLRPELKHLTYAECLEIVVKYYKRWGREIKTPQKEVQTCLFDIH